MSAGQRSTIIDQERGNPARSHTLAVLPSLVVVDHNIPMTQNQRSCGLSLNQHQLGPLLK